MRWEEFLQLARRLTLWNDDGTIAQYGMPAEPTTFTSRVLPVIIAVVLTICIAVCVGAMRRSQTAQVAGNRPTNWAAYACISP